MSDSSVPDWVQAVVVSLLMIGSAASAWAVNSGELATLTEKVFQLETDSVHREDQMDEIRTQVTVVNGHLMGVGARLEEIKFNQARFVLVFDRFSSSIESLSIAVARLESRLDTTDH